MPLPRMGCGFGRSGTSRTAPGPAWCWSTATGTTWGATATFRDAMLADRFAVHAYDVRGHGRSDGTRGGVAGLLRLHRRAGGVRRQRSRPMPGGAAAVHRRPQPRGADHPQLAPRRLGGQPPPSVDWSVAPRISPWPSARRRGRPRPARLLSRIAPGFAHPHRAQRSATSAVTRRPSRPPTPTRSTAARPLPGGSPRPPRAQQQVLAGGARHAHSSAADAPRRGSRRLGGERRRFFETLASADKRLREWPSMRHEIFNEIGKEEVYAETSRWISAHL